MGTSDIYLQFDSAEHTILQPPEPEWEWSVGGDWYSGTFRVIKSPHWLGRFLQKWLLDIHWRKIK